MHQQGRYFGELRKIISNYIKYYTIIDFNEVDIRIHLSDFKSDIHRGRKADVILLLRVDKSLCLAKLKSIFYYVIWFVRRFARSGGCP